MKKIYLFAGMAALMLASCSTEEQSTSGYVAGSKVTLNASLPNSGTRVTETADATYGLITNWSDDDSLDVLVNTNVIVPMTKSTGNAFTATLADLTVGPGFEAGHTVYGVNNKYNDNITTALNGSQLQATLDFTGQNGTVDNLKKYDLMYGNGDPTSNITFNHKICVLRLDINSDSLKADGITSLVGLKLKYVATSGTQLFATKEVYNFGATCDSTITSADSIYLNKTNITVVDGKATVYIAVPHRQNLYGSLYITMKGVAGTNVPKMYTLTKAFTLSNARMLMSTVHQQPITGLSRITKVNVGDFLYSDGSWGSLADNLDFANPVALIFSNKTSTLDKGHNWTHGYAIALKFASTSVIWGPSGTNPTGKYDATTTARIADKDGYTLTQLINNSTYPAAYAVATSYKSIVSAPSKTSGWYLPSQGQWYDICVNLGKMTTDYNDQTTWFYWSDGASSCAANLNSCLTGLTSGTYDGFPVSTSWVYSYWCSSEFNSTTASCASFATNGRIGMGDNTKNTYSNLARAVIAF